jgi:hypothetical protein
VALTTVVRAYPPLVYDAMYSLDIHNDVSDKPSSYVFKVDEYCIYPDDESIRYL